MLNPEESGNSMTSNLRRDASWVPAIGSLRVLRSYRARSFARSLARCNFDFHARYARKSRKLRARAARVKPRTGYWISFLKTFVTPAPSLLDPRTPARLRNRFGAS